MKRKIYLLLSVILMTSFSYAQSTDQNYIVTRTYNYNTTNGTDSIITIQYFDGLGRPIETVQKGITPQHNDLATFIEYDGVGRQWKNHLPVIGVGSGALVAQSSFSDNPLYDGDERAYTETKYEASPLNRVTEQFGAGQAWGAANKRVTTAYDTNTSGEVKLFRVDASNNLIADGTYVTATLFKTVTADEDRKQTTEYKDKLGQVVMQRRGTTDIADTYYVYNDLGQLSYVLPPLAADAGGSADAINKYGYVYKYDERGNCIYKKLPGCDPIYMAYDKANRMIVSQDGNQRMEGRALVTRYDVFGRVVYTHTTYYFPNKYQQNVLKNTVVSETYIGTGVTGYTALNYGISIPIVKLLSVNYYDNYTFVSSDSLKYNDTTGYSKAYTDKSGIQKPAFTDLNAKGLLTGTRTYLLEEYPGGYTTTVNYYDNKGNIVQQLSTNHLGGYDRIYNDLDFTGKPKKNLKTHSIPDSPDGTEYETGQCWTAANVSELYTYVYDHAGRVIKTDYSINKKPNVTLVDMSIGGYDELGRLILKKRHNTDIESFQYNIRNWPRKITSGAFVENLYYNTNLPENATACYNGNISAIDWKYNTIINGYNYTYDDMNRLKISLAFLNGTYNEHYVEDYTCDKQGRISYLYRTGRDGTILDLLDMRYNGNQLRNVFDEYGSRNQYNVKEYQDKADNGWNSSVNEMIYDANGNLTTDLDRDIVTIKYNLLNLPDIIQFKNGNQICNLYDAGGRKLRTEYSTLGTPVIVPVGSIGSAGDPTNCSDYIYGTEYLDNFEYGFENDCGNYVMYLDKIYNSEGYAMGLYNNYPYWYSALNYNYYRKDHLGNIREVWCANTNGTVQRTQYYPSGLPWAEGEGQEVQNKKYNGKEWIEAHGLDEYYSIARNLYPAILRTNTIDPLAEKYYSISPYAWCGNNQVNRVDPDGRDIKIWYTDNNGNQQSWIFNGQNKMMPKNEFVQSFVQAYNYNVKNGGGDNLKEAAFSKDFTVQIVETKEDSDRGDMEVTRNGRTHNESMVSWNPSFGLETADGKAISPATILEHETDHEVDYLTNTPTHRVNEKIDDTQYANKEERRVITGSEAKTARANKEFPKNYVRPDHDRSKFIITPSVTSNKRLKYY